jgi:large subunit ribosomal protein L4
MSAATFTKTGSKAASPAKLDKKVFGVEVKNHGLLHAGYSAYLDNGRGNYARTLKRGEVRGGGRKPWRQKGTGRARFGSSRNPIWRGGGITFGPTGNENYSRKLHTATKRQAIRQSLSLKANSDAIKVIETFETKDGLVKPTVKLLDKIGAKGNILLVVSVKDGLVERATRNLANVKATQAKYLNVYDILNADTLVISQKSLDQIHKWLSPSSTKNDKAGGKS